MKPRRSYTEQDLRYLKMLSRQYPTVQDAGTEIINLQAILNLPKGCEHFISDVHGEYEAFLHILNSCSGVIRDRLDLLVGDAKAKGVSFITLEATAMGRPLYEKYGFILMNNEMEFPDQSENSL